MNKDLELSFAMSDEEIERIKNILCACSGVRHYLLKISDSEELDVIEYKEYQKLEQENQQLKDQRKELRTWLEEQIKHEYKGSITYEVYYKMLSKLNELEDSNVKDKR